MDILLTMLRMARSLRFSCCSRGRLADMMMEWVGVVWILWQDLRANLLFLEREDLREESRWDTGEALF